MAIVNVSLNISDKEFHRVLHTKTGFNVLLEPPGAIVYRLLDQIKPARIFATGCLRDTDPSALMSDGWDTFYIAKWVQEHQATFDCVEIDPKAVELCKNFLQTHGLDRFVTLWTNDSIPFMEIWDQPVDMFILDSCDGLEHGLAEFKSALNFNPKFIIMDDWDTKVKLAAEYATSVGITFEQINRYTVFKVEE